MLLMAMRSFPYLCEHDVHPYTSLTSSDFARSHDNAKFASSGGDRSVFLWDVATGVTTRRLAGHMGKIHVVEFNEDASVVASGRFLPPYYNGHDDISSRIV